MATNCALLKYLLRVMAKHSFLEACFRSQGMSSLVSDAGCVAGREYALSCSFHGINKAFGREDPLLQCMYHMIHYACYEAVCALDLQLRIIVYNLSRRYHIRQSSRTGRPMKDLIHKLDPFFLGGFIRSYGFCFQWRLSFTSSVHLLGPASLGLLASSSIRRSSLTISSFFFTSLHFHPRHPLPSSRYTS